jgi:hypothetical protein
MKITVELNQKSIKNAIALLKAQQRVLSDQLMPEFMLRSAECIKNRANKILYSSDIGIDVVQDIASKWEINVVSKDHLILHNSSWKSAYVEFGVGIIGQSDKHPNADNTDYEYNVESSAKFGQGYWQFNVSNQHELDIPQDAIIFQNYANDKLSVITQGTKGIWYLYNAVEDFKLRERQRLWAELKEKYFK